MHTKAKSTSNPWIALASAEFEQIMLRWGFKSRKEFARHLGFNERTFYKLNSRHPDGSLQLETWHTILRNLMALAPVEFGATAWSSEVRCLEETLLRVNACLPMTDQVKRMILAQERSLSGIH